MAGSRMPWFRQSCPSSRQPNSWGSRAARGRRTQESVMKSFSRLPRHIGIIPDGNRRWAQDKGLKKQDGYESGLRPGLELYELCLELGIKELTFYGFTVDNTKRPSVQIRAFQKACVDAVSYTHLRAHETGRNLVCRL